MKLNTDLARGLRFVSGHSLLRIVSKKSVAPSASLPVTSSNLATRSFFTSMKTVSKHRRKQLEKNPYGAPPRARVNSGQQAKVAAPFGVFNASKSDPEVLNTEALIQRYLMCTGKDNLVDAGLHILHNPTVWKDFYSAQNPTIKRAMRALVQVQTIQALLRAKYYLPYDGENVDGEEKKELKYVRLDRKKLIAPALNSIKYESGHKYTMASSPSQEFITVVQVIAGDCLDAALSPLLASARGAKEPLVLDMASMSLPGGGWRKASAAQEENLHRRTNLMHCLEDPYKVYPERPWDYPIPQFGGLYIPGVTVFRGCEADGYPFLAEPRLVSIVASAALKMPPTETDPNTGEEVLDSRLARDTMRKIEAILSIAVEHGHTFLVLSAFGCGAYSNPPGHIARLFKEALAKPTYKKRFSHVIFAIIDDQFAKNEDESTHESSDSDTDDEDPLAPSHIIDPSKKKPKALVEKIDTSGYPKSAIFAQVFGVDVLNPDGSILYKLTKSE